MKKVKRKKLKKHGGDRPGSGRRITFINGVSVHIMLTQNMLSRIDQQRGDATKSDYIRAAIEEKLNRTECAKKENQNEQG